MTTVYKGRVFAVETGKRRFPNGREHDVEIVRHPACVVLIPVDADGRVILVRQYRAAIDRETWELPAGSIDPGEAPEAAARRECEEETGRAPHRVEALGAWFPTPGYCDELMHVFRATGLRSPWAGEEAHQDEDEDIEAKPFSIAAIKAMIADAQIIDLKIIVGLVLLGESTR